MKLLPLRLLVLAAALHMVARGAPVLPQPDSADVAARLPGTAIVFSAVLQVEEAEKVSQLLVARAESLGGWFSRRSKAALELRLPTSLADTFIAGLADAGILLDRNLTTENLEGERVELQSRLKAREAMLRDYYAMLKESSDSTVFTIQKEIVALQTEIEQTAASILKLEDRMAHAKVFLNFRFQERTTPITTGVSRFRWLNRLDIPSLRKRFDYETLRQ